MVERTKEGKSYRATAFVPCEWTVWKTTREIFRGGSGADGKRTIEASAEGREGRRPETGEKADGGEDEEAAAAQQAEKEG